MKRSTASPSWQSLLLVFGLLFGATAKPATSGELFSQGLKEYDGGNYPAAIKNWEELKQQSDSSAVRYNLGHAYYRAKQMGRAIFELRKAQELSPRDPDLKFNLNYLRHHTVDKVPSLSEWAFLSDKEIQGWFAAVSFLAWLAVAFGAWSQNPKLRPFSRTLIGLWIVSLLFTLAQVWTRNPFGVVIANEASVYSGLGKDTVLLFQLHEGTEFTVGDQTQPEWLQIQLPDGKKGWLKRDEAVFEG